MPFKRKTKAKKSGPGAQAKPAANRHSVGAMSNKRTAGTEGAKMHVSSRLAPSVPFQMTTRRGAKTTSSHTSPTAPSSASSGSRRNSLDDVARFEGDPSDFEDERPAKRSRTLTDSGSPQRSNGSQNNHAAASMNGTQTPELQEEEEVDATLSTPKTTGKRRRASDESTQSSKTMGARPNGLLTRTQSDISEQQPRRKKRKKTETPADSADQPPELTDASTAPNSPDPIPEVDGSQSLHNVLPTNGDAPAKPGRRLPGRRRQPHPDINIETDLRRQLNLKMSYRSLAKVQKSLLEELASRTLNHLDKDAEFHVKCPEYGPLMAALDAHRDGRLDQVHAMRTYRLEQLERVKTAEKLIQEEQYINRFQELQDDFLLQCYFRMKRIEREMKYREHDATDDEENVLPPTYTDEPHHTMDDRVGSKFASRSRAYVEADKELEWESVRRRFDQARSTFVEQNDDADDSIEESVGGFARFTGPDRTEAFAHYNLACLADAAAEVQRTPSPVAGATRHHVLDNEHASLLMMLADLSAQQTRPSDGSGSKIEENPIKPEPLGADQDSGLARASSPPILLATSSNALPDAVLSSPIRGKEQPLGPSMGPSQTKAADLTQESGLESSQQAIPTRVTTHRITDILNDDREVPVSRVRESQLQSIEPASSTGGNAATSHSASRSGEPTQNEEKPIDQALMDALEAPPHAPSNPPTPPPPQLPSWSQPSIASSSAPEEALRRRDPLQKIRELLDRKAREHGRDPSERSQTWRNPYSHNNDAAHPHDRPELAGYDPQRPSTGLYGASPSAQPAHPSMARRESKDYGHSHWDRDRRMSGSQAPQQPSASPYQLSAPMPYKGEHQRTDPTPPAHQSPYAPPHGSVSLPPKPPGPPPSGPINFRFAHYDPVPPRQPYPPPSPGYPPASSPVHPPNQLHYAPYGGPPVYSGGYIPPPSAFQAPPPPNPSYPPLKIHQYGGQPILPANMAPPPPQHSGPPMMFIGQPMSPSMYPSPNQGPPPGPQYEQQQPPQPQRDAGTERPAEPQSRPRRPYRSYHAPGTQFRSYQGPGERRRGG